MQERLRQCCRSLHRRFSRCSDAASLGEYALLLGVVSVALVLVLLPFRNAIGNRIGQTATTLSSASDPAGASAEDGAADAGGRGRGGGNGNAGTNQGNGPSSNNGSNGPGNPRRP